MDMERMGMDMERALLPPLPFPSAHPSGRDGARALSAACLRFTFRLGVEPLVRVRVSVMARVRFELGPGFRLGLGLRFAKG